MARKNTTKKNIQESDLSGLRDLQRKCVNHLACASGLCQPLPGAVYMAIIACIMILTMIGKLPTKRTYEMICCYLLGLAELDELEAHLQKLSPK